MKPARTLFVCLALTAGVSRAADLVVDLPDSTTAKFAAALAPSVAQAEEGVGIDGSTTGQTIQFHGLAAKTPYDLKIRLTSGQLLHGVNMAWYSLEPADPNAGPITDDDRRQIGALVSDIKSFYNISRILALSGDHNRATVLVERIRTAPFTTGGNGEVIWRVELWYFVNEFGGWQERPQTAKVLRRERFKTQAEYDNTVSPIRWLPALGGIVFDKPDEKRELAVPTDALAVPTTQP